MSGESKKTVLVALGANVTVAAVKIAGAALTGSPALFSQSAQSVADTLDELFLLTALRRSARPADERHPLGYGLERFFWSLLAAVGIFVAGAGFSGIEAYEAFRPGTISGGYFQIAYVVLAIVFVAEATSFLRALGQLRGEARHGGRRVLEHLRLSDDPTVKTVAGEDAVAVVGVVVSVAGVVLHQVTGARWWEGVSAAVVAALLVLTAVLLGRDAKAVLIGESAPAPLRRELAEYLEDCRGVDDLLDLVTVLIGVSEIVVVARVDLASELNADDVESLSAAIEAEVTSRWPQVRRCYLDVRRSPALAPRHAS